METKFKPQDPETIVGFENVLAEFNEINGAQIVFTDNYMANYDLYVGSETTRDGYEVYTIADSQGGVYIGENVWYYQPSAYDIINAVNESVCGTSTFVVYIEDFSDVSYDLEDYMMEELHTNYMNWLDENTEA